MERFVIGYENMCDDSTAVLSGAGWDASYSLDDLLTEDLNVGVVSSGASSASVTVAWPADMPVRLVALVRPYGSLTAQVQVELLDAGGSAITGGMASAVDLYPDGLWPDSVSDARKARMLADLKEAGFTWVFLLTAETNCRAVRITATDGPGFTLKRIYAGPCWQPANNIKYGFSPRIVDLTDTERGGRGYQYAGNTLIRRELAASAEISDAGNEAAYQHLYDLLASMGKRNPVVLAMNPEATNELMLKETYYGYLLVDEFTAPQWGMSSVGFVLEEVTA